MDLGSIPGLVLLVSLCTSHLISLAPESSCKMRKTMIPMSPRVGMKAEQDNACT